MQIYFSLNTQMINVTFEYLECGKNSIVLISAVKRNMIRHEHRVFFCFENKLVTSVSAPKFLPQTVCSVLNCCIVLQHPAKICCKGSGLPKSWPIQWTARANFKLRQVTGQILRPLVNKSHAQIRIYRPKMYVSCTAESRWTLKSKPDDQTMTGATVRFLHWGAFLFPVGPQTVMHLILRQANIIWPIQQTPTHRFIAFY